MAHRPGKQDSLGRMAGRVHQSIRGKLDNVSTRGLSSCRRSGRIFFSRSRAQRATASFSQTVSTVSGSASVSQIHMSSRMSGRNGDSMCPTLSYGPGKEASTIPSWERSTGEKDIQSVQVLQRETFVGWCWVTWSGVG